MTELVVLVDERDQPIGTLPKSEVHHASTSRHRGFSLFIFNKKGELLLQQRSHLKKTFPLVWSNSCCGHPAPDEDYRAAAIRRAMYELGLDLEKIHTILPDFRYTAEMNGIVENEICPVMVAFTDQPPKINPDEVEAVRWLPWADWLQEVKANPQNYSSWCVEETLLLEKSKGFQRIYEEKVKRT